MSFYLNTFVGPVLLAPRKLDYVMQTVHWCNNVSCKQYGRHASDGFCPSCGTRIQNFQMRSAEPEDVITYADIIERFTDAGLDEDTLMLHRAEISNNISNTHLIFVPNGMRNDPGRAFTPNDNKNFAVEISDTNISQEMTWFEVEYAAYIRVVRELFPEARVAWIVMNHEG